MSGAELVAWAFRSPRRLATVVLVAVAVLVAVGVWTQRSEPAAGSGAAAAPSSAPSPATAGARVPDAQPFVSTAVQFVGQWARLRPGEGAQQWQNRVTPLVTADLAAALRLTDPTTLPGGAPDGEPEVRFVSGASALVAVPLSGGERVLVTVVDDAGRWRVSDVQPDQGDTGAAP